MKLLKINSLNNGLQTLDETIEFPLRTAMCSKILNKSEEQRIRDIGASVLHVIGLMNLMIIIKRRKWLLQIFLKLQEI